jgi:NAD(P)-dependent dehydrogenase (short-subunit alcohol dehydrogenase family)
MSKNTSYSGRAAVITGAGSGIGRALALHAANLGMKVVVAELSKERGEAVKEEIESLSGEAIFVQTDVTDFASMQTLAEKSLAAFSDIALLVNNAGVSVMGKIWETPVEQWDRSIDINFRGALYGIKAFLPAMLDTGKEHAICNIASLASFSMDGKAAPYFTTKHAILSLSECLQIELEQDNKPIRVHVAAPGMIDTRIFEDTVAVEQTGEDQKQMMGSILKKIGMPPEEAAKIIFDGIADNQFVISTHSGMTESLARQRAEYLNDIHNKRPKPSNPDFV